tara:strand:+ start:128 stop:301 length:174 start_codon:yes stop_codon:yes gene_type:complete
MEQSIIDFFANTTGTGWLLFFILCVLSFCLVILIDIFDQLRMIQRNTLPKGFGGLAE